MTPASARMAAINSGAREVEVDGSTADMASSIDSARVDAQRPAPHHGQDGLPALDHQQALPVRGGVQVGERRPALHLAALAVLVLEAEAQTEPQPGQRLDLDELPGHVDLIALGVLGIGE